MSTIGQTKIFRPSVGMRFQMRGSDFEVCFAHQGVVRYASVAGGMPYRITFSRFIELQAQNEAAVLKPELYAHDEIEKVADGNYSIVGLATDALRRGMRRVHYAEAAMAELVFPNSIKHIDAWLPTFAEQIKDPEPPKARAVSKWVNKLRTNGRDALLVSEKKRGNRTLRFSPEIHFLVLEAAETFMQAEQRDITDFMAHIAGRLAEQDLLTKDGEKVKIPSESTIRRIIRKIDPYLLLRIKKGPLAAERAARAAGKVIASPGPLHIVQIDTHFLKVFVVDPETGEILGVPYLACAFDVRTRCVVGMFISLMPASAATTLGAVRDMLSRPRDGLPGGIPIFLIPDNGVEFKNCAVLRVATNLLIHFEPAMVRDPNGKAHVESFFRTLSNFLIQKIKGTTFSNPDKRGDYESEKFAYATLEQVEKYVRYWVENEYHQRPHSGTGRIPIRMWEEETAKAKPDGLSKEEIDVIARTPYRCSINHGRVRVEKNYYYSHALVAIEKLHKGRVTVLLNELDLRNVCVEHPFEKNSFITADSVDPEYTRGLTLSEHAEAQKIKKQMTKDDLRAIGKNANLLARWQLLQMINKDSKMARSKIAKLTQGKGRLSHGKGVKSGAADDTTVLPSVVEQSLDQRRQPGIGMRKISDPSNVAPPHAQAGDDSGQTPAPDAGTANSTIYRLE